MKTQIITDQAGYVTIQYDIPSDGSRIERTFMCPPEGGYVRESVNGDWKQVCERLNTMGSTLRCSNRGALTALIRSEYRAMRRAEKRETENLRSY